MNLEVKGNKDNSNFTVIGPAHSGKSTFGKQYIELGYTYLALDNLVSEVPLKDEIIKFFEIDDYKEFNDLQIKILNNLYILINKGNNKFVFDDILNYVDKDIKRQVTKSLDRKGIKFINITSNIEEVLLTDYLVVLYQENIVLEGKTLEVLKEEKIIRKLGLSLPFIVDISIQLQYYGLVDKIYLDNDELVCELWKL